MIARNFAILIDKIVVGQTIRRSPASLPNVESLAPPDLQMNVEGRERENRHGQPALS